MAVYKGFSSNKIDTVKLNNLFSTPSETVPQPDTESSIVKPEHQHRLPGLKSQGITRIKKLKKLSDNDIDEYEESILDIMEDPQNPLSSQAQFFDNEDLLPKEDEKENVSDESFDDILDDNFFNDENDDHSNDTEDNDSENDDTYLALKHDIFENTVIEEIPEEIVQKKDLTDEEFEDHIVEKIKSRMEETESEIENRLAEVETDIETRLAETEKAIQEQKETSQNEIDALKETEQGKIADGLDAYKAEKAELLEQELVTMRKDMLDKLEKEKQEILEKAFSESYEKAKKEVEEKLQSQSQELLKAINSVEESKKELIGKERDDILKLAVHAAEYMTRRQLEVSEDAFDDIIKEALDRVTDKDKVILKVAKEDVERVRKKINKFLEFMPDIKTLEVHKDIHQSPGGCIIETKLGYVDTSMDIKLEALEKAIVETYKEEHPEQFKNTETEETSTDSEQSTEAAPE